MTPTGTTGIAITAGMLAALIMWLCQLVHLEPPPEAVAGTIAALFMGAAHGVAKGVLWWVNRRWPTKGAP